MKKIFFALFVILASCAPEKDSSESSGGSSQGAAYATCAQVPSSPTPTSHNCPGASGTWNNYEIIKNSSGAVSSVELWCGATDQDYPATQTEYNSTMVSSGYTSNEDYKSDIDCASGSNTSASGTIINIWQKQ